MANKKKLDDEFNILTSSEIKQANDIAAALSVINKENIVTEIEPMEVKKFIVQQNENIKDLSKLSLEEKTEVELDTIANQADQAFIDLMDIALNTQGKACGDIASAANNFLTIKLNSKLAKLDAKMKKLNYDLNKQKFEASLNKNNDDEDDDEDDGIQIINV